MTNLEVAHYFTFTSRLKVAVLARVRLNLGVHSVVRLKVAVGIEAGVRTQATEEFGSFLVVR